MSMVGEVMFFCGEGGGFAHVTDEHDVAAEEYAQRMAREYYDQHGEGAPLDRHVEWFSEGREASERRLSMRESAQVSEAIALLKRCGYRVGRRVRTESE